MSSIKTKIAIFALSLLATTAAFAQPTIQWRGSGGWGMHTHYGRLYDPQTVETISGEVVKVEQIKPLAGMTYGIHLLVNTGTEQISVHVGPSWFIENQDIAIKPEDVVEVTGSRIKLDDAYVIIASKITKGDQSLYLRDRYGVPIWGGWSGV